MLAAAESQNDSAARLKQSGLTNVEFALDGLEHLTVMFDAPQATSDDTFDTEAAD